MPSEGQRLQSDEDLRSLLCGIRSIAVLGIRSEKSADRPAHYVPASVQSSGYRVIPVPVYDPDASVILGQPVFRSLAAIGEPIDMVDVFRKVEDLPAHVEDILKARPKAVWLQSGISSESFARSMTAAGIDVVMDRCLMVEIRRLKARPQPS